MSEHRPDVPHATRSRAVRNMLVAAGVGALVLIGGAVYATSSNQSPAVVDTAPAPHIELYATALQGEVHQPLLTPETFSFGDDVAGCDYDYGSGRECVPYHFPPSVKNTASDKCDWLKKEGFGPLEARVVDRQGLAPAGGPLAADGKPYVCPAQLGTG